MRYIFIGGVLVLVLLSGLASSRSQSSERQDGGSSCQPALQTARLELPDLHRLVSSQMFAQPDKKPVKFDNAVLCPEKDDERPPEFTARGTVKEDWNVECYVYDAEYNFYFGTTTYDRPAWSSAFNTIPDPGMNSVPYTFGAAFASDIAAEGPGEFAMIIKNGAMDCPNKYKGGKKPPNIAANGAMLSIQKVCIGKKVVVEGKTSKPGMAKVIVFLKTYFPGEASKTVAHKAVDPEKNGDFSAELKIEGLRPGRYFVFATTAGHTADIRHLLLHPKDSRPGQLPGQ